MHEGPLKIEIDAEHLVKPSQAPQLFATGIKSKLLYFSNENHWVLNAHNGLVWQREFFKWLKETL